MTEDGVSGLDQATRRTGTSATEADGLVALIRRWWWLPLLGLLVGLVSGALAGTGRQSSFEAQGTLVIGPSPSLTDPREIADSLNALDRRSVVATFAAIPASRTVRRRSQNQLRMSQAQMDEFTVEARIIPDSNVLTLSVHGPEPAITLRLADEIARQTMIVSRGLYSIYGLKLLDRPELTTKEGDEDNVTSRGALLGGVLGLLIGLAGAYYLGRRGDRARSTTGRLPAGTAAPPR